MSSEPDPTILRTRKHDGYGRAVRVNVATYSQIIALCALLHADAATIVRAAIAALYTAHYKRSWKSTPKRPMANTPANVRQIVSDVSRGTYRYPEGKE